MKTSTQYVCQNCGSISSKWMGKCSKCESWNSYMEEIIKEKREKKEVWKKNNLEKNKPINLDKISNEERKRIITSDKELNRVLGGGIVPGSVILIGGEPGIGKSTLMLQFVLALKSLKTLYVSGEESKEQIKIRSERIGEKNQNCFIYTETNLESLFLASQNLDPNILIIDSIQTLSTNNLESTPGSISQIKECTFELMKYCKENGKTVFLIGHITKDGIIAGPKILEHMVDVVVIFEGDKNLSYRLLRTKKNRYGPTNSLGIYEMAEKGLKEVSNPSDILISQKDNELSGVCIGNIVEGNFNGRKVQHPTGTKVAMNLFGFQKSIFSLLNKEFKVFLNKNINEPKKEFLLPEVVGKENVYVDVTNENWFGVTYKNDSDIVKNKIKNLVENNTYPSNLWS